MATSIRSSKSAMSSSDSLTPKTTPRINNVSLAIIPVADLRGGRNRRMPPPLNVSQTAVKMVYKQFAGRSRIKNWINDNQQLLVNSLINKTIHASQSARLYCYTSLLDITLFIFCVSRRRRKMYSIVVRRVCLCVLCVCVCVSVCVTVRGRMPTLLHGPGCNLGEW